MNSRETASEALITAELDALTPLEIKSVDLAHLRSWVDLELSTSPSGIDPRVEAEFVSKKLAREFVLSQSSGLRMQPNSKAEELLRTYVYCLVRVKLSQGA